MKYFYDEEFIDDGKTIDLISLGIVAEDGREYYAQRAEFRPEHADAFVRRNVLPHLQPCITYPTCPVAAGGTPEEPDWNFGWHVHDGHVGYVFAADGVTHERVRCDNPACPWRKEYDLKREVLDFVDPARYGKVELYGYYADYDHVALCHLWGTMSALPKGLPMWTRDLKQLCVMLGDPDLPEQDKGEHHALADARWNRDVYNWLRAEHAAGRLEYQPL